jgi:hypothetical protein
LDTRPLSPARRGELPDRTEPLRAAPGSARAQTQGSPATACPNGGSLQACATVGGQCWYARSDGADYQCDAGCSCDSAAASPNLARQA